MEQIQLAAVRRTVEKGAAKRLRQIGRVPGILYGYGFETLPLQFEALALQRILTQAGASQLIHLRLDDGSSTLPVLAREIQRDVLTGEPMHVDFLAVSMSEKITAEVAITLVGEPVAFATVDAMLLQGTSTVEIECLPGDLIPSLEVDVSELEVDGSIYVGDLVMPGSVTVLSDPQEMVAQVVRERLEEEEEEEEEGLLVEGAPEIEVITSGRTDEDEEE